MKWNENRSVVSNSLWLHRLSPPGSSVPEDSLGKNTGVDCHALLQGIFPSQGSNPGVLHCRGILCHLSHQGSPKILEWVAYAFSRGSSWTGTQTRVSCIAGWFFTSWATREARVVVYCLGITWEREKRAKNIKIWPFVLVSMHDPKVWILMKIIIESTFLGCSS